ncbi:Retrovirus-related Pol polyprotein from transposon RE1 [Vitis vinifera]|uniref:Retrovirus-related Pol polyprotein from transposon RE1 n=1 Tax=Vitis vinifera TaxID=29760 RepID=A0A438CMH3_VITVI|nr:Retrovirus-related Pol polyprotein from transposon RE1 [Vitis vinifera]
MHSGRLFFVHQKKGKSFTALLIYVDDILITGNDPVSIATTKKFLHSHFHLKDLDDLKYFLGIEVSASKNGIFISQRKYALEIIEDAGLLGAAPIDTPMERGLKFLIRAICSRIKFMHQPRKAHMEAAFRVVRYLKNAPGQEGPLQAMCIPWTFTDFLEIKATENSVTLFTEAEYRAMTGACSLHIIANPIFHERTRHIDMDCHYIGTRSRWFHYYKTCELSAPTCRHSD